MRISLRTILVTSAVFLLAGSCFGSWWYYGCYWLGHGDYQKEGSYKTRVELISGGSMVVVSAYRLRL